MNNLQPVNKSGIKVVRCVLTRTGGFQPMEVRPWHTDITDERTVSVFQEACFDNRVVDKLSITDMASDIIKPLGHSLGEVHISGGWNMSRVRFFLEVEVDNGLGYANRQILTGYSDHEGITMQGSIDDNMRLYFNNTINIHSVFNAANNRNSISIRDSSQILSAAALNTNNGNSWRDGFSQPQSDFQLMRPMDLFADLNIANSPYNTAGDLRHDVGALGVTKSRRSNANPTDYLSRSINGLINAELELDLPSETRIGISNSNDAFNDVYSKARGRVAENKLASDNFLAYINNRLQYTNTGYVTFKDLASLFPELRTNTVVANVGNAKLGNYQNSNHFKGSDYETLAVNIFSNTVASLMTDCALQRAAFDITNDTIGGQTVMKLDIIHGFTNIDNTQFGLMFKDKVVSEAMPLVTHNNQIPVSIYASMDLLGMSIIMISYNNGPQIRYEIPSFADASFSPVLTTDKSIISNTAYDIEALAGIVSTNYGNLHHKQESSDNRFKLPDNNVSLNNNSNFNTGVNNESRRFNFGV